MSPRRRAVDKSGIRRSAAEHVERYLRGEGYAVDQWPTLLLTTTGRRSGEPRIAPLIYGRVGDRLIVVASFGGSDSHPAWYVNLQEQPEVHVQVQTDRFPAIARTASGAERADLWTLLVELFPYYKGYEERADREIPVVVLERR